MKVKGVAAHSGALDIGPTHLWVRPGWAACQRFPFRSPVDLGEMDDDKIDCKRCVKILDGQKFIMSQLPVMPHPISTTPTGYTFQDVEIARRVIFGTYASRATVEPWDHIDQLHDRMREAMAAEGFSSQFVELVLSFEPKEEQ